MNMGDSALDAKSAEALLFVNMGEYALHAKTAEALLFVNMGDSALNAKSVEAVFFFLRAWEIKRSLQIVRWRFYC